jgi:hypothetical protein
VPGSGLRPCLAPLFGPTYMRQSHTYVPRSSQMSGPIPLLPQNPQSCGYGYTLTPLAHHPRSVSPTTGGMIHPDRYLDSSPRGMSGGPRRPRPNASALCIKGRHSLVAALQLWSPSIPFLSLPSSLSPLPPQSKLTGVPLPLMPIPILFSLYLYLYPLPLPYSV